MKCKIMHESKNRIRIHVYRKYMTFEEADKLESYILRLDMVKSVNVNERTSDAVIGYDDRHRSELVRALSEFDFEACDLPEITHTGREIRHEYEDRMFWHIARRFTSRWFMPFSIRRIITVIKSVPYIVKGLKTLKDHRLEVPLLDATSIAVSILMGDFDTAGSVMFLLGVGDIMEEWTHKKSVDDLARAMSLNVDRVWLVTESGEEVLTGINEVKAGDRFVVRMGNMIPLDGVVTDGEALINQASITGESMPVEKHKGAYIYAGTVCDEGEITVEVKKSAGEGQYDRVVHMIEESEKLKSATEDKAFKMADKLVPYTFGATALTYLLTRNVTRAVSILMVDFCCALKLSMPIAVLSAMREAGQHNVSVKGGKFLEAVAEADTIIFDKTGTLTHACPTVKDVVTFGGEDKDEMLRLAACLEEHYPHSMANAVVKAAEDKGLTHEEKHTRVEYVVAHGIASTIDDKKVVVGSYHFVFEDEGCVIPDEDKARFESLPEQYSHLYMAIGGRLVAVILIEDPLKTEASATVRQLHELGMDKIVMLTGDSDRVAGRIAEQVGVDDYISQVLPEDKAAYIRREHEHGRKVIMIGDGVNDSPALSEADVGIAINSGAAIAREIADITIGADDLSTLVFLRRLSVALSERTRGNYRKVLSFNSILILLGALGVLPATTTALLHNGSTIMFSLQSMTNLVDE